MVLLEDIRCGLSLKKKVRAFLRSYQRAETLLKNLRLNNIRPSDPAVILFTSGTETLPKASP